MISIYGFRGLFFRHEIRRYEYPDSYLKSPFRPHIQSVSFSHSIKKFPHWHKYPFLLNLYRRVSKTRCKFQRIYSGTVYNAVYIYVSDILGFSDSGKHFFQSILEYLVGFTPIHHSSSFADERPEVSRKKSFVFKVYIYGIDKIISVKKCPDAYFYSLNKFLDHENRRFFLPDILVFFKHLNQIFSAIFLPHNQKTFSGRGGISAWLENISIRI